MIPDKCVNSGLLIDDILIKTKWYLEIKTKWLWWLKQSDTCVNGGKRMVIPVLMVVYWMMILWLKVIPVSMVVYWMMI